MPKPTYAFSRAVLHFETWEGRGRVYLYAGDRRWMTERTEFKKAPLDLECPGLLSGETVEVWAVLEADSPFCAINRPVRWEFRR